MSGNDRYSIGLKLGPNDKGDKRIVTLDTEIVTRQIASTAAKDIAPQLDRMHDKIIETFESSITDQTRKRMDTEQGVRA